MSYCIFVYLILIKGNLDSHMWQLYTILDCVAIENNESPFADI